MRKCANTINLHIYTFAHPHIKITPTSSGISEDTIINLPPESCHSEPGEEWKGNEGGF
ncbi:MAG: hypothetical protein M3342_16535 [Bacteroidota bacterium]|nr:hypothetical protein [Flavisolibacter sp.]MBD0294504.1 hypothetical protein [Flavisolibacter sp.]MBD0351699.1 hypothetical protein [Flavisolibacter sp.]MBD0374688.1 hypothetical protein [Flavisolibacter sp.]MDQ3845594.1 hypothetical protein [Bacteroidota bacterium]